jgi:hypothetical protein
MNWPMARIAAAAILLGLAPWGAAQLLPQTKPSRAPSDKPAQTSSKTVRFHRVSEPREGAFTMLIPDGWTVEGGVYRINPGKAGGAGNAVAAKVDFVVKRDSAGTVMTHRLPDMLYKDMRRSPAASMFPTGSNYSGMTVSPPMDAISYLMNVVFRKQRPQARNVKVVAKVPLPKAAQSYDRIDHMMAPQINYQNNTGLVLVSYEERGIRFTEVLYADIQVWGMGADMWGNKDTYMARAPAEEFERMCRVFKLMNESTKLDPKWIQRELRSQGERGKTIAGVQQHNAQIEDEMVRQRQTTNAEIHNQVQLVLTETSSEINPHTGKAEVTLGRPSGGVYYDPNGGRAILSTDANWDPEQDPATRGMGWKKAKE